MLPDKFNRTVDLIQIAASGTCEYKCSYCSVNRIQPPQRLFPTEHILRFLRVMAALGLKRVRFLGGGEPLERVDILELLTGVSSIKNLYIESLSTNGKRLPECARFIKELGVRKIYVHIPALDKGLFKSITGVDGLDSAIAGLDAAVASGIHTSVKMPLVPGVNYGEIEKIVDFAVQREVDVLLVDAMSIPSKERITFEEIIAKLDGKRHNLEKPEGEALMKEACRIEGAKTHLRIITSEMKRTCGECNRLWLSANGILSMCNGLVTDLDLNSILDEDPTDNELAQWGVKIALSKPMHEKAYCHKPKKTREQTSAPRVNN